MILEFNEFVSKRKIYLDMDGVLCDFLKKFEDLTGYDFDKYAQEKGWSMAWKTIEGSGVKFWSNMDWINDGKKLWGYLKNLRGVEILTGSPREKVGEQAKIGKEIWVKNNLGDVKINHIEGKLKYTFVRNGEILIDDSIRNCELWDAAGGISILHKNADSTIGKLKIILNV